MQRISGYACALNAAVESEHAYACTATTIIRQHTSAYVSIHQHTSAYASIRQHTSAYVSIRQHTFVCSATSSIRQHTSAYVNIHTHAAPQVADVGRRWQTLAYVSIQAAVGRGGSGLGSDVVRRCSCCTSVVSLCSGSCRRYANEQPPACRPATSTIREHT
jgi:hypothetical protein